MLSQSVSAEPLHCNPFLQNWMPTGVAAAVREGASSAELCKFRIRPLERNKGTLQVVPNLYDEVLLRVQK